MSNGPNQHPTVPISTGSARNNPANTGSARNNPANTGNATRDQRFSGVKNNWGQWSTEEINSRINEIQYKDCGKHHRPHPSKESSQ